MTLQLLTSFSQGAALVGNLAAFLLGAGFALLLALAGLLIIATLAGWLFDKTTARISARWVAKGIKPRCRLGQVIHAHAVRNG